MGLFTTPSVFPLYPVTPVGGGGRATTMMISDLLSSCFCMKARTFRFNFSDFCCCWCGPFLKPLLNLLQYCFCLFYVLCFWPWGMWDLSDPTRDGTGTPCFGRQSPNHWTSREVFPQIRFQWIWKLVVVVGLSLLKPFHKFISTTYFLVLNTFSFNI